MRTPREMITAKFDRSAFVLTFETDEIIGYRAGSRSGLLRALHINLERRTVEYELSQEGMMIKRRTEYCPTVSHLVEGLPVTFDAFDQKLHGGMKLEEDSRTAASTRRGAPAADVRDPWDLTNYYDKSHARKPHKKFLLKRNDEESR